MSNYFDYFSKASTNFSSLMEPLSYRDLTQPEKLAFTFLQDGETEEASLTYQELDQRSKATAVQLQSLHANGSCSLMLYPPGLEFFTAFFGCLYAGVVVVPAYPPRPIQSMFRLQAIIADAQAAVVLTTTTILVNIEGQFSQNPSLQTLRWLTTDNIASELASSWQELTVSSEMLALLQRTSGSTETPKGVMVNHGNLLHNQRLIQWVFKHTEQSMVVCWLPLYHDMGLIGNMLQPLYLGIPCILMSPAAFLQRPWRWLQAISHYKATTSGGPNFAYDLCVRKIIPEKLATLDLSSWKVAFNGAEPVRAWTLDRFAATFEPCGFCREAFYPCYGMVVTTLIVSGGLKAAPPVLQPLQRMALEQNRVVLASRENSDREEGEL